MLRLTQLLVVAVLLSIAPWPSEAAAPRKWVSLVNCQYVAGRDNDGDSFRVHCGTDEFILRLYFVDAPETNLVFPERTREQSEHFGVTLDDTMKAGVKAKATVQDLLRDPFVVQTRWASAQGRSRETRFYGIVEVGGKNLAEVLVSQGLARTKGTSVKLPNGEKARAYMGRLEVLEGVAQQRRLGVWASSVEKKIESRTK
jgi:endonuclease YncB( thermonuclease family)